jgi:hypothetical protein
MGGITRILWADFYYKIGNSAAVVISEKVLNEAHGVKWIAEQEARILNNVSESDLEAYKTSPENEGNLWVGTSGSIIENYRRDRIEISSSLRWEIVED